MCSRSYKIIIYSLETEKKDHNKFANEMKGRYIVNSNVIKFKYEEGGLLCEHIVSWTDYLFVGKTSYITKYLSRMSVSCKKIIRGAVKR